MHASMALPVGPCGRAARIRAGRQRPLLRPDEDVDRPRLQGCRRKGRDLAHRSRHARQGARRSGHVPCRGACARRGLCVCRTARRHRDTARRAIPPRSTRGRATAPPCRPCVDRSARAHATPPMSAKCCGFSAVRMVRSRAWRSSIMSTQTAARCSFPDTARAWPPPRRARRCCRPCRRRRDSYRRRPHRRCAHASPTHRPAPPRAARRRWPTG